MPDKSSRLKCKNINCPRSSLELVVKADDEPVIRVKNRHDGKSHTTEYSLAEIKKAFDNICVNTKKAQN